MGELTGPERDYASYMSSLAELVEDRTIPMGYPGVRVSQLVICGVADCIHRLSVGRESEENTGRVERAIGNILAVVAGDSVLGEDDLW